MPVIILAGEEEFELTRRVAELKSTLLVPPWHTINFIKLNSPDFSTLADAAATLVLGQGKRIVLVEDCQFFTKKRGKSTGTESNDESDSSKSKGGKKSIDSSIEEDFVFMLSSVSENTYLILACPYNFDSTLRLSKAARPLAKLEEFPKERYFPGSHSPKLESWCRTEAKKHGATMDEAAIQYLLSATEANLRQLSSEIEKVAIAILPQTAITYKIVSDICSSHGHIFQFVDLWLSGQTNKAINTLQELLAQQSAMPVIAALQTMLSKWIKLKALYEQYSTGGAISAGQVAKQIASELKLLPFSVEKDLRRLQKHNVASLVEKRLQLTRLEYAIKVGQIPDHHALSLFVLG